MMAKATEQDVRTFNVGSDVSFSGKGVKIAGPGKMASPSTGAKPSKPGAMTYKGGIVYKIK